MPVVGDAQPGCLSASASGQGVFLVGDTRDRPADRRGSGPRRGSVVRLGRRRRTPCDLVEVGMTSLAQSVIARASKQRDLLQSMIEQSKTITARVTSRDRAVSAEVDGLGQLTGLWLGPPASRLGADVLAALHVGTAHRAAKGAAARGSF